MAYKEVTQAPAWDFEENPVVEGEYLGKQTDVGQNKSMLYRFRQDDGTVVAVWGSSVLDTKMANIAEGQRVKIEFLGKKKSPTKGHQPYKDFSVFVDDEK
jgi:hypothetical protein